MVWSKWKAAALATLVLVCVTSSSLVYSQQAAPQPPASGTKTGDVVTVQEAGKPAQKFVIQKSYRGADGKTVYEMRNVKTGEVSTFYNDSKSPPNTNNNTKTKATTTPAADAKGNSNIKLVSATSTTSTSSNPAPAQGAIVMQPSSTASSTDAKSKPTLVQWLRSWRSNSSDYAVSQTPAPSPSKVSTTNSAKPSLVQWLRGSSSGSQPDPFSQDRIVASSGSFDGKLQPMAAGSPYAQTPTVATQYRTIEEPGQAPLKCRVAATWRTADGKKASQLQALESGETLTIVESGPAGDNEGSSGKTTATLYHWGHNKTAPVGVPLPPLNAYAAGKPALTTGPTTTAAAKMPKLTEVPVVTNEEKRMELPSAPEPVTSSKSSEAAKPMPKVLDAFKAYDTGKTVEAPKAAETAKLPQQPKAADFVRPMEAPKPPETAKAIEMPKPPEKPKVIDATKAPAIPPPPPMPTGVGKPALDTTTPATSALPSMPTSLSTASNAPSAPPALPLPPMPAQLALDNSLPPALPSITPSNSMLGSQFVRSTKNDPLSSPDSFAPLSDQKALAKTPAKSLVGGSAQATDYPRVPLGAASVAAASNAGDGCVLPAQAAGAFPGSPQMSVGRIAQVPDQAGFANAFSVPPSVVQQQTNGMAFQQTIQMPPMMPNGYPMPPTNPGMMAGGYPMPPNPGMMPGGYPMPPANPSMMGYGYGPTPMPAMPMQGQMPIAMTPGYGMQGQMPQPQMPIAMAPAQSHVGYANPAMDRPGVPVSGGVTVTQCVGVLQSSLYPSQREIAVNQLGSCDWRANPHVVTILLTTAKEDPAAMVRVAAVNALARMGIATDSAIATYNQLTSDTDTRVRLEAEQALKTVGSR